MKTKEEMVAFAEGYLRCHLHDEHTGESIKGVDEWVSWDVYELHFFGQDCAEDVPEYALKMVAYHHQHKALTTPVFTTIVQQ
jgi:hypothetical protein